MLYGFDGLGGLQTLASVSSSGEPGQAFVTVGLSHVVDNPAEALVVRTSFGGSTTSLLRICGVRVRYNLP